MLAIAASLPSQTSCQPLVRAKEAAAERRKLEQDLRAATARGGFVLHYQPRVSLCTGATVGAEALSAGRTAAGVSCRPPRSSPRRSSPG
jgi:sensor c-di-GMP phosphodiesterase-like protein